MLASLRGLDELMTYVWEKAVTTDVRNRASEATDAYVARLTSPPPELSAAVAERARTREPYADWTFALVAKGSYLQRGDLRGLRWLAGKLLHYGPLPAAEMRHWRAGAEPRWKWRAADAIFPPSEGEKQPSQRAAYEKHLRGRDVVGTVLMTDPLIETEYLFYRLLRDSDEEQEIKWDGT
jgi:hypothetical protein